MVAWEPSLRPASHRAAEVDPDVVETEVFKRLDSDSSGYLTFEEMEPLIAMSSLKLRFRVPTAIKCGGQPGAGLSLPQFAAVFREDEKKSVLKYYEQWVAAKEMDASTPVTPRTGRWRVKNEMSKILEAADVESEVQASAHPWASPSRKLLSTSPKQGAAADFKAELQAGGRPLASPFRARLSTSPKQATAADSKAELQVSALDSRPSSKPTEEELEASMEKVVEEAAIPSNPKTGGKSTAGNSQGSKSGRCGPRKSTVDAPADTGADSPAATAVKWKMVNPQSPAKSDKDGQETHRNRDEVRNQILDVVKGSACLQQVDFDFKVRQHLHAILCHSGQAKLREALVAVSDISAKKKRTDVRNWAAYIVKILQSFHSDASAAAVEQVAEDEGAKANELSNAMAEIQRLKEELAAKEELPRDAALPARQRASTGAMLAPDTDSEDEADEEDDQEDLDTFPAPPDSQSWEWPLSRHEKKVRVQQLERQIYAADRSALIKEVKDIRRASLASARNA